jgi:aryl-alcohol dehydrogenase-like predicted oxidoreductase
MNRRPLGHSGLDVSVISFGCMSLGSDQPHNTRLIHEALDLGINTFDTADLYQHGENEISLGKAIAGRRDSVIIATKAGNQWRPDGSGWDWNASKAYIKSAVTASLKRLGTDFIDLYQLHGGTLDDPLDETREAFEDLVQAGSIRHYGISSIRPTVIDAWTRTSGITSLMTQYSLLDRRPEEQSLGIVQDAGIGVIVRGAVAQGMLATKAPAGYLDHDSSSVQAAQAILKTVGEAGESVAETALRFCLAHPAVTTVACGIRTRDQLLENAAAADKPPLPETALTSLRTAVPARVYPNHRLTGDGL